ncbi:LITAF-like zinc ribbon domain-containing protein [Aspergillus flavus]|uniref:LITAF-like zinc ribbon domain-containing protein n=1 Tax=Aspergillus flavus (strain ATCC 200026 / FGSC A1120 / IAM 13836 / NRRL 3357 / JCM 12722 / SRRC 167) TaxID=332952 RepID=A0A7U2MEU7_ASPFN|nr:LITAF-like zinc ribbon domain-containing protein [Aspergillus flavus]
MAEKPSILEADKDRDRQTGAAPAGRANDGNDNMKENPAPTSPPPIQSVSSQIPLTGVSPQVIPLIALSTYPAIIDCPNCHARTTTRVNLTTGARATCWSCLCCLCLGPFAALLPCLLPNCKDYEHYCGNCNRLLAVVERSGATRIIVY